MILRSHSQISSLYLYPQMFSLTSFVFLVSVWSFGSVVKSDGALPEDLGLILGTT